MTKRREPTNRKAKPDAKKTGGQTRLSAAQRRRRKGEADRRYYERHRSGCAVTAYLDSPEMKEALIEKLRPLGYTVSDAIRIIVKALVEGRATLKGKSKKPE
jgi:cobalamin biosynthesis Mg chelatase CobN